MDGITILNTSVSLTTGAFLTFLILVFPGIILISIGIAQLCYEEWTSGIIFSVAAILLFMICGHIVINDKYKENIYQVTIDKDLKFEDFMNKYKIIDQEGLLYTVVERKDGE